MQRTSNSNLSSDGKVTRTINDKVEADRLNENSTKSTKMRLHLISSMAERRQGIRVRTHKIFKVHLKKSKISGRCDFNEKWKGISQ